MRPLITAIVVIAIIFAAVYFIKFNKISISNGSTTTTVNPSNQQNQNNPTTTIKPRISTIKITTTTLGATVGENAQNLAESALDQELNTATENISASDIENSIAS